MTKKCFILLINIKSTKLCSKPIYQLMYRMCGSKFAKLIDSSQMSINQQAFRSMGGAWQSVSSDRAGLQSTFRRKHGVGA